MTVIFAVLDRNLILVVRIPVYKISSFFSTKDIIDIRNMNGEFFLSIIALKHGIHFM